MPGQRDQNCEKQHGDQRHPRDRKTENGSPQPWPARSMAKTSQCKKPNAECNHVDAEAGDAKVCDRTGSGLIVRTATGFEITVRTATGFEDYVQVAAP